MTEINWAAQPLGQITDSALAARLGVHRDRVALVRQRRGIHVFVAIEDALTSRGPRKKPPFKRWKVQSH